ncbi:MAG: hypothetical protein QS721_12625 [Candidatus Endonucleobacter sp. (ex Gigantidas childressi)]|nr:hypothetical protein [Candidatus Endonucleobacter sp. (ex Gigantidas childressi)]
MSFDGDRLLAVISYHKRLYIRVMGFARCSPIHMFNGKNYIFALTTQLLIFYIHR